MTVASEITRLQGAKSDIRQAIIDKGVDVGANLTIDEYAACIMAIEAVKRGYIDLLVVGGGGGGRNSYDAGGGGGAGGVIYIERYPIKLDSYNISVGHGGGNGGSGGNTSFIKCDTCLIATGGGAGAINGTGGSGGSGGGGSGGGQGGSSITGQGNNGGGSSSVGYCWWDSSKSRRRGAAAPTNGGGGGYSSAGCSGIGVSYTCAVGGDGGEGFLSDITGENRCYAGGGGGSACCVTGDYGFVGYRGYGKYGGGDGYLPGCNATAAFCCGSGGGGGAGTNNGGNGIVVIRYKTDGSCGICNTSTGGTKYTCGDYTIHCFTNTSATELFTPVYK